VAAIRAHGTFGSIRGPITCDAAALAEATSECFQGTRSDDKYSPNIFGADFSLGWTMAGGRLRPYLGGGYNRLEPRFQVNFTNQFGMVDNTRIEVNLNRGVVFGGATWQLADRLGVAAEVYAVPADAVTARLVVRTAIGRAARSDAAALSRRGRARGHVEFRRSRYDRSFHRNHDHSAG